MCTTRCTHRLAQSRDNVFQRINQSKSQSAWMVAYGACCENMVKGGEDGQCDSGRESRHGPGLDYLYPRPPCRRSHQSNDTSWKAVNQLAQPSFPQINLPKHGRKNHPMRPSNIGQPVHDVARSNKRLRSMEPSCLGSARRTLKVVPTGILLAEAHQIRSTAVHDSNISP